MQPREMARLFAEEEANKALQQKPLTIAALKQCVTKRLKKRGIPVNYDDPKIQKDISTAIARVFWRSGGKEDLIPLLVQPYQK